eukprot:6220108-Amphidinium_carterae.1
MSVVGTKRPYMTGGARRKGRDQHCNFKIIVVRPHLRNPGSMVFGGVWGAAEDLGVFNGCIKFVSEKYGFLACPALKAQGWSMSYRSNETPTRGGVLRWFHVLGFL